jgi:hypothetical protein
MFVQEMVKKLHGARQTKLDITKVFNTMDWAFIVEVMSK